MDQVIDVPVIVLVSGVEKATVEAPQSQFFDRGRRFFLLVVATLVVIHGSGMFSTGFAGIPAPRLRSRRLPAGSVVASCHSLYGNREGDSAFAMWSRS